MDVLVTIVVIALFVGFAAFLLIRNRALRTKDDDLLAAGVPATATVLSLRHDAASAEDDLYILSIEVEVPAAAPRAGARVPVEMRSFLPTHAMPAVQPGCQISVRLDPRDPARAALDLAAMKLA